jgi:hypothetical protein
VDYSATGKTFIMYFMICACERKPVVHGLPATCIWHFLGAPVVHDAAGALTANECPDQLTIFVILDRLVCSVVDCVVMHMRKNDHGGVH